MLSPSHGLACGCVERNSWFFSKYLSAFSHDFEWMICFTSSSKKRWKKSRGVFPVMCGTTPGASENATIEAAVCVCVCVCVCVNYSTARKCGCACIPV